MKYKYSFLLIIIFFISIFFGINEVRATEVSTDSSVILQNDNSEEVCTSLLGGNLKKDLEQVLKIIRVAGPVLVVFLTSAEFITAIASKDDDAIKKCTSKLVTRLILVAILFFLPTILNLLLGFIDQKYTTCIK